MTVKFIKDPVGKYSLCYEVGQEIELSDSQAMDLIEDGYAVPIPEKIENASDKRVKEKR